MESQSHGSKSILRIKQVQDRTGLSSATIYRRMAAEEFPLPIDLGGNLVGWIESEVTAWIDKRISACTDRQLRQSKQATKRKMESRRVQSPASLEQTS